MADRARSDARPHAPSHPRRWWRTTTRFLAARLDPHSSLGLWLTLDVLLLAGAVWGFGGLLEEVLDREALVRWDVSVVGWLRAHSSPLGDRIFAAVTILGSPVNWVIAGAVALWLLWRRERFLLVTLLAGTAGGKLLELALKTTIHRHRPSQMAAMLSGHTFSFPSGHAMNATVCYALVAFVLATALESRVRVRARWYATAAAVALAVAFSRIYLGMHFPSDVIGGLAAGVAWVVLCMAVVKVARSRIAA